MVAETNPYIHYGLRVVVACSLAHNFLPPYEFLDEFPAAQKYYKLLVYVVGYIALNARSTVWRQLSTQDGSKPSTAATNGKNGGNGK